MLSNYEHGMLAAVGAAMILCALPLLIGVQATQIIPSTIETIDALFSRAPIAIEGEVIAHQDIYDERVGALALWQIKVIEVFKDSTKSIEAGSVIELETMGFEKADTSVLTIAEIGPPIHAGMCAILLLQKSQKNYFQLFELRTTGFFEVDGMVVRRAVLNHFLPGEMSADSLRDVFRAGKTPAEIHVKDK